MSKSGPNPGPSRNINIRSILKPVQPQIVLSIVVSSISVIANVCSMLTMAFLANYLISEPVVGFDVVIPLLLLLLLLILNFISMYSRLKATDISHFASFDLELILRLRLTKHITQMPIGQIYRLGQGTLIKVLQNDVKGIHAYVADAPPLIAKAVVAPILITIILLFLSWKLTLFLVILFLSFNVLARVAFPNLQDKLKEYSESREEIASSIIEFVQAMPIVKIFDSGSTSFQRYKTSIYKFKEMMVRWYDQAGTAYKISLCLLSPITTLLGTLWFGLYLSYHQQLDFVSWLAILLLGSGLIESVTPLLFLQESVHKAKMSIQRILEIELVDTLPISSQPQQVDKYDIEFNDVCFKYSDESDFGLKNISFTVPENTFTAIIGASGSGKSTIARLIPRLWDVTQGVIKIGGIDIKEIQPDELMNYVSFVFQDNFLFYDSLANNISYGLENVTQEDIIEAAKKAQAHEFITRLPNGYETMVGERGTNLSGGQKQRITIARAFLQNRPILILDEATSHADPENEALLIQAIAQLMKSKTVIMVAHRLSTIRDAHQILVLDDGVITERGLHQDLMNQKQKYYQLWQAYEKARSWRLQV